MYRHRGPLEVLFRIRDRLDDTCRRTKDPYFPAVVEIDGANGNGILHVLGEVTPKTVKIGMAVEAVWKPESERKGDITDIRYWRPRRSGGKKKARSKPKAKARPRAKPKARAKAKSKRKAKKSKGGRR